MAAVLLSACGDAAIPRSVIPAEIAGLRSTSVRDLDAQTLAAEALDVDVLGGLLESAGFRAALERTYVGPDPGIRRVEVRVVRFGSASGAERFLSWQRQHAMDAIGDPSAADGTVDGVPVYVHLPDGCCPKEQVLALAAWTRGADVVRVIVAGPDADGPSGTALIGALAEEIPADA